MTCQSLDLAMSLDNVRASEACEPWLQGLQAKMVSQLVNHTVIES